MNYDKKCKWHKSCGYDFCHGEGICPEFEKGKPRKIIRENFMIKYHCPICNNDEIKGCDYCSSCGKKLDWSEVSHRWA